MKSSMLSSVLNMTADVYVQQNTQSDSGAITRDWVYDRTIQCKVIPYKTGALGRTDSKQFSVGPGYDYEEKLRLSMKCLQPISKRERLTGIRANNGEKVYMELDRYDQPDTIFEVLASHTVLDPLGKIAYFDVNIQRVSIQNDTTQTD
jgi:hypothetical protein